MESESAGKFIVSEMQDRVRENTLSCVVIGQTVPRNMSKEERSAAILEPRYEGNTVLHYKGGVVNELETQLTMLRPKFDDLRDGMVIAVKNAKKPMAHNKRKKRFVKQAALSSRSAVSFGGRRR